MAYAPMHTRYPQLRGVVQPEYESLSDSELANVVAAEVGMSADLVENWLSNLGRTVSRIAPGVLSGAVQGFVSGMPFGGPLGGIAGALLGGVGGAMRGAPTPGAAGVSAGPSPPTPAAQPGAPAAGALMQLLGNPDLQRALMSMFLGPRMGARNLNVAGQNVPVAEFANLMREAADQALTQHDLAGGGAEAGEGLPEYLDAERRRGSDTGDPFVRGVVLAKLLDQPTYVPVPTAPPPPQTTVVYGQPGAAPVAPPGAPPAPGAPVPPGAPPAVDPGAFEPVPQYGTPDLGIGQPIATEAGERAERAERQRSERTFQENLDSVFELDEAVL